MTLQSTLIQDLVPKAGPTVLVAGFCSTPEAMSASTHSRASAATVVSQLET